LAAIVRALIGSDDSHRHDEQWLMAWANEADLGPHAVLALETLRQKPCWGAALLSGDGVESWL
jgi:hypothetical protein